MRLLFPAFLKSKMIIGKNIRAFLILHSLKPTKVLLRNFYQAEKKVKEKKRETETQNNKKDTKVFL